MDLMIPELREQFRLALLSVLDAAASVGLRESSLCLHMKAAGFEPTLVELRTELTYLDDKKFVAELSKQISPELRRWRITATGRDFLATEGLA